MIWLANYTTDTLYNGDYEFCQYTQTGNVAGIDGNVDKSFWYVKTKNDENETTYAEIDCKFRLI